MLLETELSCERVADYLRATRHLEKFFNDDSLVSANSEHESEFWDRGQVVSREVEIGS